MTRILCAVLMAAGLNFATAPRAPALEIGKPAPNFTLPSASGENVSLKQFRGQRMVLIEFFGAAFAPT
jgi:peroxiredoxin